jgi:hypothetical protein
MDANLWNDILLNRVLEKRGWRKIYRQKEKRRCIGLYVLDFSQSVIPNGWDGGIIYRDQCQSEASHSHQRQDGQQLAGFRLEAAPGKLKI